MGSKKPWDERRLALQRVLKQLREDAGLTQEDLAVRLKKDQSFVSRYERGERRLDLIELAEIAEACGFRLAELTKRYEGETHAGGAVQASTKKR